MVGKNNRAKIGVGPVGPLDQPFANTTTIFSASLKFTPPNRRHFSFNLAPTKWLERVKWREWRQWLEWLEWLDFIITVLYKY